MRFPLTLFPVGMHGPFGRYAARTSATAALKRANLALRSERIAFAAVHRCRA